MKLEIEDLKGLVYLRNLNNYQLGLAITEFEKLINYVGELEQLINSGITSSAFLVQHKDTLINHGFFSTKEKAESYINGSDNFSIQAFQIN